MFLSLEEWRSAACEACVSEIFALKCEHVFCVYTICPYLKKNCTYIRKSYSKNNRVTNQIWYFHCLVIERRMVLTQQLLTHARASERSERAFHFNQPLPLPGTLCRLRVCIPMLPWQQTDVIGRSKGAFGISNQVTVWFPFCVAILRFDCWDLVP